MSNTHTQNDLLEDIVAFLIWALFTAWWAWEAKEDGVTLSAAFAAALYFSSVWDILGKVPKNDNIAGTLFAIKSIVAAILVAFGVFQLPIPLQILHFFIWMFMLLLLIWYFLLDDFLFLDQKETKFLNRILNLAAASQNQMNCLYSLCVAVVLQNSTILKIQCLSRRFLATKKANELRLSRAAAALINGSNLRTFMAKLWYRFFATKIQTIFRQYMTKKKAKLFSVSALRIQTAARCSLVSAFFALKKESAIKIQTTVRGFLAVKMADFERHKREMMSVLMDLRGDPSPEEELEMMRIAIHQNPTIDITEDGYYSFWFGYGEESFILSDP